MEAYLSHVLTLFLFIYFILLSLQCKKISVEELKELQSVAGGLPNCVLKHIKAKELLNDPEALKNISKRMRKGQLKAMLEVVSKGGAGNTG